VKAFEINPANCQSLEDAKRLADELVSKWRVPDLIKLVVFILNGDAAIEDLAVKRWKASGKETLL
jgi:hypothetical protein